MNITKNKLLVSATSKSIRISPSKINLILSKIRGKSYKEVLIFFKNSSHKSSTVVWQTLYSAISNATKNFKFIKENLIIKEAYANQGAILKRFRYRAKGNRFDIQKKTSHITIVVGNKFEQNIFKKLK